MMTTMSGHVMRQILLEAACQGMESHPVDDEMRETLGCIVRTSSMERPLRCCGHSIGRRHESHLSWMTLSSFQSVVGQPR